MSPQMSLKPDWKLSQPFFSKMVAVADCARLLGLASPATPTYSAAAHVLDLSREFPVYPMWTCISRVPNSVSLECSL